MKHLSRDKLQEIIKKSMPGYDLVDPEPLEVDGPLPSQAQTAGLAKIQQKLAAQVVPYRSNEDTLVTDSEGKDVVQAVEVTTKAGRFAKERKTVLISSAQEKIVGEQG